MNLDVITLVRSHRAKLGLHGNKHPITNGVHVAKHVCRPIGDPLHSRYWARGTRHHICGHDMTGQQRKSATTDLSRPALPHL
jgi:hypothetical protein